MDLKHIPHGAFDDRKQAGALLLTLSLLSFSGGCRPLSAEELTDIDEQYSKGATELKLGVQGNFGNSINLRIVPEANLAQVSDCGFYALIAARDILEKLRFQGQDDTFDSGTLLYEDSASLEFKLDRGTPKPDAAQANIYDDCAREIVQGKGYRELTSEAKVAREYLVGAIRSVAIRLQELSTQGAYDGVTSELLADLVTWLPILADRLESQELLTGRNILNFHHKGGTTSVLIGRTEHFHEAIAALDFLRKSEK